jgi:hypothetical protein
VVDSDVDHAPTIAFAIELEAYTVPGSPDFAAHDAHFRIDTTRAQATRLC